MISLLLIGLLIASLAAVIVTFIYSPIMSWHKGVTVFLRPDLENYSQCIKEAINDVPGITMDAEEERTRLISLLHTPVDHMGIPVNVLITHHFTNNPSDNSAIVEAFGPGRLLLQPWRTVHVTPIVKSIADSIRKHCGR